MRNSIFLLFVGIILSLTSCRKDFDTVPSTGTLEFSKETVYLDTVFTGISSSTYMLKVYNRSKDDIVIPTIRLARENTKYRIMVDGMTGDGGKGTTFSNVELLAKDSLFVFIETTPDIIDTGDFADFLYTDVIEFHSSGHTQSVNLVTLVQDAVFLYPTKENGIKERLLLGLDGEGNNVTVEGFELNEADPVNGNELHWTKEKPYVVYGFAGVPDGKNLVIDAGARIHFHTTTDTATSGIVVLPNGQININGEASPNPENPQENEVIFEGDRLEPMYADIPGQWGAIWLLGTTRNNTIKHTTIKNATIGLLSESSTLTIDNSQIYDNSLIGLQATASTVTGTNLVINTSGQANLACNFGGSYSFKYCTFNNNWASSNQVSVILNNYTSNPDGSIADTNPLVKADFFNCIIYGSNRIQLFLDKADASAFNYNFDHCLIKFNDSGTSLANDAKYDFIRQQQNGNIKNEDPEFTNIARNKLTLLEGSAAIGKAVYDPLVPKDILGNDRPVSGPDVGAYQYISN